MASEIINYQLSGRAPVTDPSHTTETAARKDLRRCKPSTARIVLLVLSILVFLVGFCLLIPGIVQGTPLLMAIGIGVISSGVVGILIAGMFNRLLQEEVSHLCKENEALRMGIGSANRWAVLEKEEACKSKKLLLEKEEALQKARRRCEFQKEISETHAEYVGGALAKSQENAKLFKKSLDLCLEEKELLKRENRMLRVILCDNVLQKVQEDIKKAG